MSTDELTPDQIAWLHERAAERRGQWVEHARKMTAEECIRMERETAALDEEIRKVWAERNRTPFKPSKDR